MSLIKSALELALERTESIQADKSSLKEKENREAGMKLFSLLEKGEAEEAQKIIDEADDERKTAIIEGLFQLVLTRIALPANEMSLEVLPVISQALEILFPGQEEILAIPGQLEEFSRRYIGDKKQLFDDLVKSFEPQLKEKEEQLFRQTGQRMKVTPDMDPEFAKALQTYMDRMNSQYGQVIDNVKEELRRNFGELHS